LQTGEPSPLLLTRFLQAMLALIALAFLAIGIQNLGAWLGTRRPVGSGSQESNNAVITADTVDEPSARALLIPRETPAPDPIIDQPWSEPREVEKLPQVHPSYPPEAVARLGLEGVLEGEDPRPPSPTVQVYRTAWGRDRNQAESIRRALDFPSGTVEIKDDGPLYEEDLHFGGLNRWIRNAPGYRPMIVVPRLSNRAISRRSSLLPLEGKDLVLEGLDFVIDASDLTSAQSSIFECRGSRLTLRDCTFTLLGFSNRPIALVAVLPASETANARESRVRIERTLVRGAGVSAVRIEGGPSRVEIVESIALTSQAPTLVASITDAQSLTRIDIAGCLLASDSPVVEIGGDASRTSRAVRLSVLQSALIAQCGIAAPPQLVAFAVNSELPDAQVYEWIGAHNVYAGWAASRSAVSSDVDGRVLTHGLAPGALHPWIRAADVAEQLPEVGPFISSTAQPHPNLQAWSSNFERLPSDEAPGGPESHGQSLEFDADASPFAGDLGRFLSESVNPTARQIRVTVAGSGRKWMTPIRLRDGVSLVIEVKSPPPGEPSLEWTWSEETAAPALIMARLANLTIRGARFARDAHPSVPQIVRVEHGNLTLDRCSLIAPWLVDDGGGGLVAFLTDGTRGLDDPPVASLDGCVLITGGVAVLADVGAGRVRIEHCGIAAGQAALELGPQDVSPGRFHADLLLDHCTLFAERDAVRFGRPQTALNRPARPWVIETRSCVFLDPFDRVGALSTSVLFHALANVLGRASAVWQSVHDYYGLPRFLVAGESLPTPGSIAVELRNWIGFWGKSRIREAAQTQGHVRPARGLISAANITTADFILESTSGEGAAMPGADPRRLGVDRPDASGVALGKNP
jgi:serine/threonine-protein kinase